MSKPLDALVPELSGTARQKMLRLRRWLRIAWWLLGGLAVLFLVTYIYTAVYGVQAVQQAVNAEALADYQALKARAPGAASAGFGGVEFLTCRAILPGLIKCTYDVSYGNEAGGVYESLYFWNGRRCERLSHQMLIVR